ncbi:unnamed protein product [Rhizophagus irregularis]|nr:unnamed protein product [Rhizophagus irregularis]
MSNNTESNIPVNFAENSNNEWINWIEEAIAKDYFKYYEFNHFLEENQVDNSKKYSLVMEYADGGLRETPIPDTPEDYVNIYTDCWNNESTINQVVFKLNAIILKNNNNMIIKDFRTNDSYTNQSSSKQQIDLNAFEDPINNPSHGELSKFIQEFNKMNTKEIDSSISSNNNFKVTVDEMVELSNKASVEAEELDRLCIYNYLNNHNMTSQEIYIWN